MLDLGFGFRPQEISHWILHLPIQASHLDTTLSFHHRNGAHAVFAKHPSPTLSSKLLCFLVLLSAIPLTPLSIRLSVFLLRTREPKSSLELLLRKKSTQAPSSRIYLCPHSTARPLRSQSIMLLRPGYLSGGQVRSRGKVQNHHRALGWRSKIQPSAGSLKGNHVTVVWRAPKNSGPSVRRNKDGTRTENNISCVSLYSNQNWPCKVGGIQWDKSSNWYTALL